MKCGMYTIEKISSWEEFFRSNRIWNLGDINWGKYFDVRQNKDARQRGALGANGSPSVATRQSFMFAVRFV
jgi:hypothetical protein